GDERLAGARRGEAQRVVDAARAQLLVARKAGQDRQAGSVGRRPALRAQVVGAQAPDRARARAPAGAAVERVGVEERVQAAGVAVDDEHVAVAVGLRAALDPRAARDRVRALVGLVGVLEGDGDALLPAAAVVTGIPIA